MKAQRSDILTALPQAIIEIILCLLPIEEAARTSILSREWRYKWTTIPKLEFHESTVERSTEVIKWKRISVSEIARDTANINHRLINAIHQVLLLRRGPIHEFSLLFEPDDTSFKKIDQIILYLSRNHAVKIFTLENQHPRSYNLPLSVFLMHRLTELHLHFCNFVHEPTFSGFGSLTSLSLSWVVMSKETLLHLLSNCPSLKRLRWIMLTEHFLDKKYPTIMELFKCLPVIEHLTTVGQILPWLIPYPVPKELPTSLIHLKYLSIEQLGFADDFGLNFLGLLIKCSPNLEKIKIEVFADNDCEEVELDELEEYTNILKEYSDVWLEHLNELEIECVRNFELEMEFVKFILARSPNLKKVILRACKNEIRLEPETKFLLHAPHASPVEIIVGNRV